MDTCPFFAKQSELIESNQTSPDRTQKFNTTIRRWCTHKHSPVTKERTYKGLGDGKLLKCEGNTDSCQVPQDLICDIS